jgi:acetyltransferase-like isoleucine patch superfamily enzyme
MTANSFLGPEELGSLGLRACGRGVKLSRFARIYHPEKLSLGDHCRIDDFCILSGEITLGACVHLAPQCLLFGASGIVMEDFSGLSSRVAIYTESDDYVAGASLTNPTVPSPYRHVSDAGPVRLGKHVIVGCGAVILPSSHLAEGVSIGALSLVRGTLEPWTVHSGNPAVKAGRRRSRTILRLEAELREAWARGEDPC